MFMFVKIMFNVYSGHVLYSVCVCVCMCIYIYMYDTWICRNNNTSRHEGMTFKTMQCGEDQLQCFIILNHSILYYSTCADFRKS